MRSGTANPRAGNDCAAARAGPAPPPSKRARKFFVHVERPAAVQAAREALPAVMHEQEIMEAVRARDVVLVTGATGTGKTTQVPQFLVEDGFGDPRGPAPGAVAVTQPRRVAAVACARRVAHEMGGPVGQLVGYQIRHEARLGEAIKVKFVTDGLLLREVENDILLRRYSAVVIDEVHERSMNTDLLLAFLSRSVVMRREKREEFGLLKVIIMSATLDVDGVFSGPGALFPDPPIVKIPSRQYPVTIHFARRTVDDYVEEAFRMVSKIHRRLPPGGVLVFLSGRQEVEQLSRQLREEFGDTKVRIPDADQELSIRVLPFYALLADNLQRAVFEDVGAGNRKVVVATNIAETSVTVPGIAYVVDSGRVKEKVYRGAGTTLLSSFEVRWVSQASAEQRAGRAGRTGPGHCYRLYSSAVFDQRFEPFHAPEMVRIPAESIVLRLRAMGIRHVAKFPFPTPPDRAAIAEAEHLLTDLGALGRDGDGVMLGVTKVGRELARLPMPPRFGRMLLAAHKRGVKVLRYAVRLAAALSVGSVLDRGDAQARARQKPLLNKRGQALMEMAAVCASEHAGAGRGGRDVHAIRAFCANTGLVARAILEALAVVTQLEHAFFKDREEREMLKPPGRIEEDGVISAFLAGFGDRVARRLEREEAIARGVAPRRARGAYCVQGERRVAYVEGAAASAGGAAELVVFAEMVEIDVMKRRTVADEAKRDDYVSSGEEDEGVERPEKEKTGPERPVERRLLLRAAAAVQPEWVACEAAALCTYKAAQDAELMRFDRSVDSVMERARVQYGQEYWVLGSMFVRAELLPAGRESRRETQRTRAFARALLGGQVRPWLQVEAEGARREAAVSVLAAGLAGVCCVRGLSSAPERRVTALAQAVQGVLGRTAVPWAEALNRLCSESSESKLHSSDRMRQGDAEEEDEYG